MIELTWGQILNSDLNNAFNKIMRQSVEFHTALKILSISKEIKAEQDKAQEMRSFLQEKYFDRVTREDGLIELKEKLGKEEELKKAQEEFAQTRFKLKSATIRQADLAKAELSALEVLALEPVMEITP
jgi:hypothetical protein